MASDDRLKNLRTLQRFVHDTRLARRMTQRDVALRGGLSKGTVAYLESGSHTSMPGVTTLQRLAKGLGVQYAVLDRILRGLPTEPDPMTETTARLLDDISPNLRAVLLEYATWPENMRMAFETGMSGLLSGIRQAQRP